MTCSVLGISLLEAWWLAHFLTDMSYYDVDPSPSHFFFLQTQSYLILVSCFFLHFVIKIIYLSIWKSILQSLSQVKKKFLSIFSSLGSQYLFQFGGLARTESQYPLSHSYSALSRDLWETDTCTQQALTDHFPVGAHL